MKNTMLITLRLPKSLNERIKALANKGFTTRNHWITRTLSREARFKPSLANRSASKEY